MKAHTAAKPPRSPTTPRFRIPAPRDSSNLLKSPSKPLTMKRLAVLYKELKDHDKKSNYPWRILILVFLFFMSFSIIHFLMTGLWRILPSVHVGFPTSTLYNRYDEIFHPDSEFAYIPSAQLFVTTTAKAGSTTFWTWLHRGVTGFANFDKCNYTEIQDFHAPCWNGSVIHPYNMTNDDRWNMLNSPSVLRVAITRDAIERIISAWKAKAACDSDDFGTDVKVRDTIVPQLLKQAHVQRDSTCLSLTSFAEVLDSLRQRVEQGKFDFKNMNKNFRPQQLHFDLIHYDLVLDVYDLTDKEALRPIIERVEFSSLLEELPVILKTSRLSLQTLSESTAALLHKYALLTPPFPRGVAQK